MGWEHKKDISVLLGKTVANIVQRDTEEIRFWCSDGSSYLMYHDQDCCESVSIDDVVGDYKDLLNTPITLAEETTDNTPKTEVQNQGEPNEWQWTDESATWTFYRLATVKGYVNIKWYGNSNGYYSERVDFEETSPPHS